MTTIYYGSIVYNVYQAYYYTNMIYNVCSTTYNLTTTAINTTHGVLSNFFQQIPENIELDDSNWVILDIPTRLISRNSLSKV